MPAISACTSSVDSSTPCDEKRSASKPPAQSGVTDTVHISGAAQAAAKAALQEATETQAQTMKEASAGDPQAKRLLAKEDAQTKV